MRTAEPTPLSGGRVRLEPLRAAHLPALVQLAADARIWQYLPTAAPRTVSDLHAVLAPTADRLTWAVLVDGDTAGMTSYLAIDPAVSGLEIGSTWYRRDLWGTAVNPQCKLLLLTHAFEQLGALRVTLKTDARNARSRAAIAKLGCQQDGTLRWDRVRSDGTVRDTTYFSLLAAEWPAARAALERRLAPIGPTGQPP